MSVLCTAIDINVPHRKCTRSRPRHFGHSSRALSKCTAKKRRLWHYLKCNPYDSRAYADYHHCVQQWRRLVKQQQASTEEHIIEANNLGTFYNFVNKCISNKSKISAVKSSTEVTLTADLDIANAFNDYFASVGVASNECSPQFPALNVPQLTTIGVTEHDVLAAINKLKANLSAGPDGLPPLFFKRVRNAIALPFAIIFEQLLSVAFVPEIWKTAVITPVHKKGPTNLLSNFRPISITCVTCKLLERLITSKIYDHLVHNNIINSNQHGFVRGKSTCTNLLESLNDWTSYVDDGCQTSIIYIDFSKAFDVVQHDKLFVKLKAYGIGGTLLQWIMNLFACRTIQTRINDLLSDVCSLLCGVIQGSVIGPLMFLVYINDLVEILAIYSFNIKVKLFADDVKLYVKIVNITDTVELQKALSALVAWADEWQLSISVNKCCVLHIGKITVMNQFHINDIPLPLVSSYRDLGITVSKDLSPTVYINEIVVKAHQRANMIHRCFVSQNVELSQRDRAAGWVDYGQRCRTGTRSQ